MKGIKRIVNLEGVLAIWEILKSVILAFRNGDGKGGVVIIVVVVVVVVVVVLFVPYSIL